MKTALIAWNAANIGQRMRTEVMIDLVAVFYAAGFAFALPWWAWLALVWLKRKWAL